MALEFISIKVTRLLMGCRIRLVHTEVTGVDGAFGIRLRGQTGSIRIKTITITMLLSTLKPIDSRRISK